MLALFGGLAATARHGHAGARVPAGDRRRDHRGHLLTGLVKTPFLALAIGLIACGQGLAAQGGAAAVGARTTSAVVLAILGVIVTNALFTLPLRVPGHLTWRHSARVRNAPHAGRTSSSTTCESAGARGCSWST